MPDAAVGTADIIKHIIFQLLPGTLKIFTPGQLLDKFFHFRKIVSFGKHRFGYLFNGNNTTGNIRR